MAHAWGNKIENVENKLETLKTKPEVFIGAYQDSVALIM